MQPAPQELAEIKQRASEVVRLLEDYKRLAHPEFEREATEPITTPRSSEDHRPPKRPWEDISQDDTAQNEVSFTEVRTDSF